METAARVKAKTAGNSERFIDKVVLHCGRVRPRGRQRGRGKTRGTGSGWKDGRQTPELSLPGTRRNGYIAPFPRGR